MSGALRNRPRKCEERMERMSRTYELLSKLLKGAYVEDYIGDYYRAF